MREVFFALPCFLTGAGSCCTGHPVPARGPQGGVCPWCGSPVLPSWWGHLTALHGPDTPQTSVQSSNHLVTPQDGRHQQPARQALGVRHSSAPFSRQMCVAVNSAAALCLLATVAERSGLVPLDDQGRRTVHSWSCERRPAGAAGRGAPLRASLLNDLGGQWPWSQGQAPGRGSWHC